MVSQTSIETYIDIKPTLRGRQQEVFKAIEELGISNNRQIAEHLDWEINRVTGRVNELRAKGKVAIAFKANHGGRMVQFYRVKHEGE